MEIRNIADMKEFNWASFHADNSAKTKKHGVPLQILSFTPDMGKESHSMQSGINLP